MCYAHCTVKTVLLRCVDLFLCFKDFEIARYPLWLVENIDSNINSLPGITAYNESIIVVVMY